MAEESVVLLICRRRALSSKQFPFNKISINFFPLLLMPFAPFISSLFVLCFYLCSSEIKRHAINNNKRALNAVCMHVYYTPLPPHCPHLAHSSRSLPQFHSSFIDPLWSNNNKKCCQTLLCDGRFLYIEMKINELCVEMWLQRRLLHVRVCFVSIYLSPCLWID